MNIESSNKIAIIIPFFKKAFLYELLNSLSNQTNKEFNVYIGNDNSPEDPAPIINKFKNSLSITYKNYPENLGHICPTFHWNRCLDLIRSEEWVWMLPDDDLISENCIAEFYESLPEVQNHKCNVITIPSKIIDADGKSMSDLGNNPKLQGIYQFYLRQLKGETIGSSLGDNIFRRSILVESGGFISFPRAWGSDHATILNTAKKRSIYCLQNAWFGFRQSGLNISSISTDGENKMIARIQFLDWIKKNENLFETKPDINFYKYFYWKAEHYVLYEWKTSFKLYQLLLQLRKKSLNSNNPLPIIKIFIKNAFKDKN